MIINLKLENNEIEKQINNILSSSIRKIVREELKALVMEEINNVSQNQIKQAVDQIPNTLKTIVQRQVASLLGHSSLVSQQDVRKELKALFDFAFPKDYLELIMTGVIESTLNQVANARLDAIASAETESVLREYKNTIREKLKDFVNRV